MLVLQLLEGSLFIVFLLLYILFDFCLIEHGRELTIGHVLVNIDHSQVHLLGGRLECNFVFVIPCTN